MSTWCLHRDQRDRLHIHIFAHGDQQTNRAGHEQPNPPSQPLYFLCLPEQEPGPGHQDRG
jgi:hypothetical protein